jgi:4-amino-4-deoxy-L-arabinose transferase-like glycosyltransferase
MLQRHTIQRLVPWLVILLSLVALALRLLDLGGESFYPDEGSSYHFAQLPLQVLLGQLCDPHPPGYYLFLRLVILLGHSETWLRLPSALAGSMAVPLTWLLARRLLAESPQVWPGQVERAALLAAGLVALNALHVWYSQEARQYALLATLALLMVLAGLHWWKRPGWGSAALFLVSGWLALFTQFGALFAWAGLNLALLAGWDRASAGWQADPRKSRWTQWLVLQGILLTPFVAWALASPQGAALLGPSYQAVFLAVRAQSAGIDLTPDEARVVIAAALVSGGLILLAGALLLRRSARFRAWARSPLVAVLLLVAMLVLMAAGAIPQLYTAKRHLTLVVPFVAVAASWALLARRPPVAGQGLNWGAVIPLLWVLSLTFSLVAVLMISKPPWRTATATLAGEASPGDSIWVDELDAPVFDYYWRHSLAWQPLYSDDLAALNQVPAEQRVWLIATTSPYRNLHETLPAQFASQRQASIRYQWPGIDLRAYDALGTPQDVQPPPQTMLWGLLLPSPLDTSCGGQ